MTRLRDELRSAGPGALEQFWREVTAAGTPLVEPWDDERCLVTFLWRGQAQSTSVTWGIEVRLTRLPDTDLWYGSRLLPADLRTIYYLTHDGDETIPTDPRGQGQSHVDAYGRHPFLFPGDPDEPTDFDQWMSLLELPAAVAEPWSTEQAGVTPGEIVHRSLESAALGGARRVSVYKPAGVATEGLPSLVAYDGYLARAVLRIPTTVDNLIAAGRIPPLVVLFVTSPNDRRDEELSPGQSIVDFTAGELMPWARRNWGISEDPDDCVITGVSRGGLAAAYVALRAPDTFGAVISQSGSFWWPSPDQGEPQWLIREYARAPRAALRFYLDVGTLETMPGPDGAPCQMEVNRAMRDTLRERGYPVVYGEYSGGHDYINWRRTFADGLIAVLGGTRR